MGGLADFAISIDSVRVAKLSNGRYLSLPVTAGQHIVAAKFLGLTIRSRSKAITVKVKLGETSYKRDADDNGP